jgi:hypothetical protein
MGYFITLWTRDAKAEEPLLIVLEVDDERNALNVSEIFLIDKEASIIKHRAEIWLGVWRIAEDEDHSLLSHDKNFLGFWHVKADPNFSMKFYRDYIDPVDAFGGKVVH